MVGCDFSGISLSLPDFKMVYDTLDYDKSGKVDFEKFCMLNTDKSTDINRLIEKIQQHSV